MFDLAPQGKLELLPDGGGWSSARGGRWGSGRRVRAPLTQWTRSPDLRSLCRWWPMSSQSNKTSGVWKKKKPWALEPPKFIWWHCKTNAAPICSMVSNGDTSFSNQMTSCYQTVRLGTLVSVCKCFGSNHRYSDAWGPRCWMEPSNTEQVHFHYEKALVSGHLLLS